MSVTAIKSRLSRLEESQQPPEHIRVLCIDIDSNGKGPGDLIDRCEAACDESVFTHALDAAFMSVNAEDKALEGNPIHFFEITEEIALKCAEELRGAGVDVKC